MQCLYDRRCFRGRGAQLFKLQASSFNRGKEPLPLGHGITGTGVWLVQPELTPHNTRQASAIHLDAVLCGIRLLPHFGDKFIYGDLHYSITLDNFHYFYVNRHIDYHTFETVV